MKRLMLTTAMLLAAVPAMAQYNPYAAMIQPIPSGQTLGYSGGPHFGSTNSFLVSPMAQPAPVTVPNPYAPNPMLGNWQQFRPGFGR